jgi:hypothetical protein
MPRDAQMARLFEARRADTGQPWSRHKRKLSGFELVFAPQQIRQPPPSLPQPGRRVPQSGMASDRAMRYVAHVLG